MSMAKQGTAASEKLWMVLDPAEGDPPEIPGIHPLVARILHQRGYSTAEAQLAFLDPKLNALSDPFLLPEMDAAVDRVLAAIDSGERVALYGDYDVDGVTSLTLFKTVLGAFGLEVSTFLPHRMAEGYGLSIEGLGRCIEEHAPSLIIAVDCGTSSIEEVAWLKGEKGIDTIICDHHEASPAGRPDCVALVNPKLGENFHYLCSAGVVFKVAHALLKRRPLDGFDLRKHLDIVAVGTVADIVPLVGENRALVRRGLHELARTENLGLAALAEAAGASAPFDSADIGFKIGPRLNASGRLASAQASLDLMLCENPGEAQALATGLDTRNRERQQIEAKIREQALAMVEESFDPERDVAIVLGSPEWHAGVVGIVASRVSKKFHRPTFIIGFDEDGAGKGSGRSVEGISLVDAINECRDCLIKGGGHAMAAGISIELDRLEEFRSAFSEAIRKQVKGDELTPRLHIDIEATLGEIDDYLLPSYLRMEPLGQHNPRPIFMVRGVHPAAEPRVLKEKHLRLSIRQGGVVREAMFFSGNESPLPRAPWDIAFTINRNEWRGKVSLQMIVEDIRTTV
ncbi:MAG: single-stranded-DNA-specific exonuclease [Verrucomicrobiales bacterium]